MAKRSIWSGSITFGLVNVPVKLFSAVSQQEVHFNMLHDKDGGRIKQQRICSKDGKPVDWDEIAKGYEIRKGRYVMISREELETLDPVATKTIDIEDFVELTEIDPIYYESTYYIVPDRGAEKAYALLHDAMTKQGKVGIARFVMRTRQYLAAVRPYGRGLAISTMNYADEIVDLDEVGAPRSKAHADPRERAMAEKLIDALSTSFKPDKYKDDYRERVLELVRAKSAGKEIEAPEAAEAPGEGLSLFDALERSLKGGGAKPDEGKRKAARAARSKRRTTASAKRSGARKKKAA